LKQFQAAPGLAQHDRLAKRQAEAVASAASVASRIFPGFILFVLDLFFSM
jgi:hypothetical protein